MADLGTAFVQIQASARGITSQLQRELGDPLGRAAETAGDDSARRFGDRFKVGLASVGRAAAIGLGAAFVGAAALGKQSIDAASNLEEAQTKIDAVFGSSAGQVTAWSDDSASAFGISQRAALEAAGTYGNLFQAFGVGQQPAQEMSTSLVELAADLASFNNTSTDEALEALRSGLSGETEPLKRFGIAIDDARLRQQAFAMGLIDSTSDAMDPAIKAQASYALIMEDSAIAQGDFARTSDGLANRQRTLSAQWENAKATLGRGLLPVVTNVATWLSETMLPAVQKMAEIWVPRLASAFNWVAGIVSSAWPTVVAIFTTVFDTLKAGFEFIISNQPVLIGILTAIGIGFALWAFSAAAAAAATLLAMAPFILIGVAIAAVVAAIVYAYQNFEWFRTVVDAVADAAVAAFNGVRDAAQWVWDKTEGLRAFIVDAFAVAWSTAVGAVDGLKTAFDTARNSAQWVWDKTEELRAFLAEAFGVGVSVATGVINALRTAFDKVRNSAQWLWDKVSEVAGNLAGLSFGAVVGAIGAIKRAMDNVVGAAQSAYEWVRKVAGATASGSVSDSFRQQAAEVRGERALGGPVSAGGSYLVGERGWEIFTPSRSGWIIPHNQAVAGMAGGGTTRIDTSGIEAAVERGAYRGAASSTKELSSAIRAGSRFG